MAKEFFKAHFFPAGYSWRERLTNSLNYYLAAFFFNAFPLPQREAGARQTLQYIGELTGGGWSVLIFPGGPAVAIGRHQAVPRRHRHDRRRGSTCRSSRCGSTASTASCRRARRLPGPARVRVAFGAPLTLRGDDYAALAEQVEDAVRAL